MNITPNELPANGYELISKLGHKDLAPFLKMYLYKRTTATVVFYAINIILLICSVLLFINDTRSAALSASDWLYHYCLGFSIAFLIIPLHEYIHVLAYRWQGAKKTSYDANIRKFYFMALADGFVANKKEFTIVGLAPFITISSTLLLLLPFLHHHWVLTIVGVLFCHTAMCSGDFALLSFFGTHKDKEVVTYDCVDEKMSYFYARSIEKPNQSK